MKLDQKERCRCPHVKQLIQYLLAASTCSILQIHVFARRWTGEQWRPAQQPAALPRKLTACQPESRLFFRSYQRYRRCVTRRRLSSRREITHRTCRSGHRHVDRQTDWHTHIHEHTGTRIMYATTGGGLATGGPTTTFTVVRCKRQTYRHNDGQPQSNGSRTAQIQYKRPPTPTAHASEAANAQPPRGVWSATPTISLGRWRGDAGAQSTWRLTAELEQYGEQM